ncbi:hypothetical protein MRBLWO14_000281 [Microbacterium sp. LWO14-1.2]|uniref:hypothetical protein n=1 Tax=Microbacterium sp. LWO14-1.2 TaxID=3135263 RepID=UPI00313968F8
MTSETPAAAAAASSNGNYVWPRFGHLTFLTVVSALSLTVAVILGIVGANMQSDYMPDLVALATLGVFSDALLLLGVIAGVGAIVLAGVRTLLGSPELAVRVRRDQV